MEQRERKGKLVRKLVFIAVAAIVGIATVLVIISGFLINNIYDTMIKEELRVADAEAGTGNITFPAPVFFCLTYIVAETII